MPEIWFYHLERQPLEAVLPQLLMMSLGRKWRVLVQTKSAAASAALSKAIWAWRDDAFLPHGFADNSNGAAFSAEQPIWLTDAGDTPNGADIIIFTDDAVRDDVSAFERCIYIFDGNDADAVRAARVRWKSFADAGQVLIYWQQDSQGRWHKKGTKQGEA